MIFIESLPAGTQRLLAIDPGADAGWALFDRRKPIGWTLTECGLLQPLKEDRIRRAAYVVVVEVPQWQRGDTPTRTNDLLKTAFRAGILAEGSGCTCCWVVNPHTWKHSVPKRLHNERTLSRLTPAELDQLELARYGNPERIPGVRVPDGKKHNVIDAIGLGLWAVGRW